MKKFVSLVGVCLALVSAAWAADFEGTVVMKVTGQAGSPLPGEMTYSIKGSAFRVDMVAPGAGRLAAVMDSTKPSMLILVLDRKLYLSQPIPPAAKPSENAGAALAEAGIQKTAITEKIAGYDCVKYIARSANSITELWATDKLGAFAAFGGGNPMMGGMGGSWEAVMGDLNLFPLRVIIIEAGKESLRMEASEVTKKTLSDAMFSAPADFQNAATMMSPKPAPGTYPGVR